MQYIHIKHPLTHKKRLGIFYSSKIAFEIQTKPPEDSGHMVSYKLSSNPKPCLPQLILLKKSPGSDIFIEIFNQLFFLSIKTQISGFSGSRNTRIILS